MKHRTHSRSMILPLLKERMVLIFHGKNFQEHKKHPLNHFELDKSKLENRILEEIILLSLY